MGLLRRVFQNRPALRKSRRHQNIDGRAHAGNIQINMTSHKALRTGSDHAVRNLHRRAQRLKPLDMLINRTASDITAARQHHRRLFKPSQKRAQKIIGCPDFAQRIAVHVQIMNQRRVHFHRMPVDPFHMCANALHGSKQDVGIPHIRHIFYQNSFIRHQRSRQNRKRRILRAAYLHLSNQRISTANRILFHIYPSTYCGFSHCACHITYRQQPSAISIFQSPKSLLGCYRLCNYYTANSYLYSLSASCKILFMKK